MSEPERRLKPEARPGPDPNWFKHHALGLVTLLLGVVAFTVVAALQTDFWAQPDWRLTVPGLVLTLATGVVSMARKEGAYYLPLLGIGLAAAAMFLGFFIIFGIVLVATLLCILIVSKFM